MLRREHSSRFNPELTLFFNRLACATLDIGLIESIERSKLAFLEFAAAVYYSAIFHPKVALLQ